MLENSKTQRKPFLKPGLGEFGQDGGIGRHTSPHFTTKRRNIINLKKKTPRTARKSPEKHPELYRNSTTKDLEKLY